MATTRRGTNNYNASTGTTHHVPLPTGSVAGDWYEVGFSNGTTGITFTQPGSSLGNADSNTFHWGLSKGQLSSTDITNNYVTITASTSTNLTAVIVGYSVCGGFDTLGTPTSKPGSSVATSALGVTSDGIQDILVWSFQKSSSQTGFSSDSPTTTDLDVAFQNGSGLPGVHLGVYTGTSATRTSSWAVSSSNGVGVQSAVTQSGGASYDKLSVWDGTTNQVVNVMGVWDGSAIQPVSVKGEWDGTTIQPVTVT